jgi:CRP-like cAMP-binding protein
MTKTYLLKLTDNEMDILSDTFEMEIQIEDDLGNDESVKYYKKLDKKLWKSNKFTQQEIGTFSKLSWEQENHYACTHEELSNYFGSLYDKVSKLLEDVKKLKEVRAKKERLEEIERNYERLLVEQVND